MITSKYVVRAMEEYSIKNSMIEALSSPEPTSLKEFILSDGRHYKLAVVDYTNLSGKTLGYYGYVTLDKKYYNHGISANCSTGAKLLDTVSYDLNSAEGNHLKFIRWV